MSSRAGARILLAIAFLAAAVAYNGWVASRTVFDPDATSSLARALLDTSSVQHSLDTQITDSVNATLTGAPNEAAVKGAVATAVRDPRVIEAFTDALHDAHAALLGNSNGTITIDARALTAAVHDALAARDPALAAQLARATPLQVKMDGSKLPHLGHARDTARTVTWLAFVAALMLTAASLMLARDRPAIGRIGRRIAYLSVGPLLMFALAPHILGGMSGDAPQIATAALRSYSGRVVPSAVALAVAGLTIAIGALVMPRTAAPEPVVPAPPEPGLPNPSAPAAARPRVEENLYL